MNKTMETMMKFIFLITLLLPTLSIADKVETDVKKTVEQSVSTRKTIESKIKERTPANASLNSWQDFENEMNSDKDWDNEINKVIKEYE